MIEERVYTSGHSLNDDQERLRNYVTQMSTEEQAGDQMCGESQDNNHRMKQHHSQYRHLSLLQSVLGKTKKKKA